jgi:hypothetical protein
VRLTTVLLPVTGLRMSGAVTPRPPRPSWLYRYEFFGTFTCKYFIFHLNLSLTRVTPLQNCILNCYLLANGHKMFSEFYVFYTVRFMVSLNHTNICTRLLVSVFSTPTHVSVNSLESSRGTHQRFISTLLSISKHTMQHTIKRMAYKT